MNLYVTEADKGRLFLVVASLEYSSAAQAAAAAYNGIAAILRKKDGVVVHERVFASLVSEQEIMDARKQTLEKRDISPDGPVTYIEGAPPGGPGLAGVIIHAVVPKNAGDVWTIFDGGTPCGRGWRRNGAEFIILQNIQGKNQPSNHPHLTSPVKGEEQYTSPARQVEAAIERAEWILREQGASYLDVIRTWFYLFDILSWYPEFNRIRNQKYGEFGIMPGPASDRLLLPASTGVGGNNPQRSAVAMDLIAVTGPAQSRPFVKQLTNVRQLDAFRYGSAFSRGTLIRESDISTIQVSGTSAIDEAGRSMYPGDARSQIAYTMDKVQTLLNQEGAELGDIAAATVFVKRSEDYALFREIIAARGLGAFPALCVVADLCRSELLFEIDAEVVVQRGKDLP